MNLPVILGVSLFFIMLILTFVLLMFMRFMFLLRRRIDDNYLTTDKRLTNLEYKINDVDRRLGIYTTFSEKIEIAYWKQIKELSVDNPYADRFANFLRQKINAIRDQSTLIHSNIGYMRKENMAKIFDLEHSYLLNFVAPSLVPDKLIDILNPISRRHLETLRIKLLEISECNFGLQRKKEEFENVILTFIKELFQQTVINFNIFADDPTNSGRASFDKFNIVSIYSYLGKNDIDAALKEINTIRLSDADKNNLVLLNNRNSQITDKQIIGEDVTQDKRELILSILSFIDRIKD
jgi:hypothetical protein